MHCYPFLMCWSSFFHKSPNLEQSLKIISFISKKQFEDVSLPPSSSLTISLMTIPLEFIKYRGLLSSWTEPFVQMTVDQKEICWSVTWNFCILLLGFGLALALQLILSPTLSLMRYCTSGQWSQVTSSMINVFVSYNYNNDHLVRLDLITVNVHLNFAFQWFRVLQ